MTSLDIEELEKRMADAGNTLDKRLMEITSEYIVKLLRDSAVRHAPVDTGHLRQLLTSEEGTVEETEEGVDISISSPAPYSIFLEYGTGFRGDPDVPHTEKTSWNYKTLVNGREVWRTGYPIGPQPFMRPALRENTKNIAKIISGLATEVFK